jgi:hypothetical protein
MRIVWNMPKLGLVRDHPALFNMGESIYMPIWLLATSAVVDHTCLFLEEEAKKDECEYSLDALPVGL